MYRFLFCFLVGLLTLTASFTKLHPYHVGSVEFNYNSTSSTFEITGRFFLDDTENALKKKFGGNAVFHDSRSKAMLQQNLKIYCEEHLKLKVDTQFIKLHFLGFEEDSEAVQIYLESAPVKNPKKVETAVSFLYNLFDDQINIIHIIVDGKRQSHKLSYPDRYLYKNF